MTDKERIEKTVNCEECPYARKVKDKKYKAIWYECTIEDRTKWHEEDFDGMRIKVIDCPLQTLKNVVNAKAVEALKILKRYFNDFDNSSTHTTYEVLYQINRVIKEFGGENE